MVTDHDRYENVLRAMELGSKLLCIEGHVASTNNFDIDFDAGEVTITCDKCGTERILHCLSSTINEETKGFMFQYWVPDKDEPGCRYSTTETVPHDDEPTRHPEQITLDKIRDTHDHDKVERSEIPWRIKGPTVRLVSVVVDNIVDELWEWYFETTEEIIDPYHLDDKLTEITVDHINTFSLINTMHIVALFGGYNSTTGFDLEFEIRRITDDIMMSFVMEHDKYQELKKQIERRNNELT